MTGRNRFGSIASSKNTAYLRGTKPFNQGNLLLAELFSFGRNKPESFHSVVMIAGVRDPFLDHNLDSLVKVIDGFRRLAKPPLRTISHVLRLRPRGDELAVRLIEGFLQGLGVRLHLNQAGA